MHYNYIHKHSQLLFKKILGQDVDSEIERVENELYKRTEVQLYGGDKGLIVKTEKNFALNCSLLAQKGHANPRNMNVFDFYAAMQLIDKQNEQHDKYKKR
jgi:hypothetical protein